MEVDGLDGRVVGRLVWLSVAGRFGCRLLVGWSAGLVVGWWIGGSALFFPCNNSEAKLLYFVILVN